MDRTRLIILNLVLLWSISMIILVHAICKCVSKQIEQYEVR